MLHTVACRIYAHGYKVTKIEGAIKTKVNKRKVLAADASGYVFPEGATIEVSVVSNAPNSVLVTVQAEAEEMSPTMMNWRQELPFLYGVARLPPKDCDGMSVISSHSLGSDTSLSGSPRHRRRNGNRILNFFWKLSHKVGEEKY